MSYAIRDISPHDPLGNEVELTFNQRYHIRNALKELIQTLSELGYRTESSQRKSWFRESYDLSITNQDSKFRLTLIPRGFSSVSTNFYLRGETGTYSLADIARGIHSKSLKIPRTN